MVYLHQDSKTKMTPDFIKNMDTTEILGLAGALIAVMAYLPQISHLIRERCTAGLSRTAFSLWLLSSLLIAIHAIKINDLVFISLNTAQIILISTILFYYARYNGQYCTYHLPVARKKRK